MVQQTYPFAGITRIRFEGSLGCMLSCGQPLSPLNGTPLGLPQRYQNRRLGADLAAEYCRASPARTPKEPPVLRQASIDPKS